MRQWGDSSNFYVSKSQVFKKMQPFRVFIESSSQTNGIGEGDAFDYNGLGINGLETFSNPTANQGKSE